MTSSIVNKMLDFMGMGDEEDSTMENENRVLEDEAFETYTSTSRGKVVDMHSKLTSKVMVSKPRRLEDMSTICNSLKQRKIILLDLKDLDYTVAQKCVDFACGCIYALDGGIQKVSSHLLLLTPSNVDVSADFKYEV